MLEKIGEAAERAATRVSRRELLGRLGRGALALSVSLALTGGKKPPPEPRVCNADSSQECYGLKEGDLCYAGFYRGLCRGPRHRGPNPPDTVACYCDIGDVDPR